MSGLPFDETVERYAWLSGLPIDVAREQIRWQLYSSIVKTKSLTELIQLGIETQHGFTCVPDPEPMDYDSGMEAQWQEANQ